MDGPVASNRLDGFIRHPKRALWVLALPMITGQLTYALYMVGDMAFIGILGPTALAAAQFVGSLFFGVVALNIGFTTGVTSVVSNAVGRGDKEGADKVASSAMGLGACLGVVLACAGWLAGKKLISLLGAEGETCALALDYFEVLCVGIALMFVSGAVRAVLTGEGDVRTPMTVMIISTLLNLTMDPVFMFVLGMGIRGAALSTVTSQLFTITAFCYVAFIKRRSYVSFRWQLSYLRPRMLLMSPVLAIGFPAAMGQIATSIGAVLYNRVIAVFGQNAVAGYGAGSKLDLLVTLPVIALANALLSLVGMLSGAGRPDLIRSVVLYSVRTVLLVVGAASILAFFFSSAIVGVFTDDPAALGVGQVYLRYISFAYPLTAFGIISGRILQGLGLGIPPLIITLTRVLLIGVPAAYIGVYGLQAPIQSIWIAMIAGAAIADVSAILWIRRYAWKEPSSFAQESTPFNLS